MILLIDNYDSFTWNLYQYFCELGAEVLVRRNDALTLEEIAALAPEKIVISPGPCTPDEAGISLAVIRHYAGKTPLLGVCLGNQLLGRACGASTLKLAFGHRGVNQPVLETATGRGLLTSQNHQYAVDAATLAGTGLEIAYKHLGDGTIEGLTHKGYDAQSVQFHPEASPGPEDAGYVFDNFVSHLRELKENN